MNYEAAAKVNREWMPSECKPVYNVSRTLYRCPDGRVGSRQIGTTQRVPDDCVVIGDYYPGSGFFSDAAQAAYEEYVVQEVSARLP